MRLCSLMMYLCLCLWVTTDVVLIKMIKHILPFCISSPLIHIWIILNYDLSFLLNILRWLPSVTCTHLSFIHFIFKNSLMLHVSCSHSIVCILHLSSLGEWYTSFCHGLVHLVVLLRMEPISYIHILSINKWHVNLIALT